MHLNVCLKKGADSTAVCSVVLTLTFKILFTCIFAMATLNFSCYLLQLFYTEFHLQCSRHCTGTTGELDVLYRRMISYWYFLVFGTVGKASSCNE